MTDERSRIRWHAADLLATAVHERQYPDHDVPEIALVGRSNVGKSSLINKLVNRRIARTSNTPGRTQTLNFYGIDGKVCFVDLPGYGYARVSKQLRQRWGPMIEHYLTRRPNLTGVLQIVDIRHPPTADDKAMAAWLIEHGVTAVGIATKADKIARGRRRQHVERMAKELGLPVMAFSSQSGEGKDDVVNIVQAMLLEAQLGTELAEADGVSAQVEADESGLSPHGGGSDGDVDGKM